MAQVPQFFWDEDSKESLCILTDGENTYVGNASCHPDDIDMSNAKTGHTIALYRAEIKAFRGRRDTLKTELKILKHLYSTMKDSKQFNPKGYETRMLRRQIKRHETDIEMTTTLITNTQKELKQYLLDKEQFYTKVRHLRKEQQLELDHNNGQT